MAINSQLLLVLGGMVAAYAVAKRLGFDKKGGALGGGGLFGTGILGKGMLGLGTGIL